MQAQLTQTEISDWQRLWRRQGKTFRQFDQRVRDVRKFLLWRAEAEAQTSAFDSPYEAANAYIDHRERVADAQGQSGWGAIHAYRGIKDYGAYLVHRDGTNPYKGLVSPRQPKPTEERTVEATQAEFDAMVSTCSTRWVDPWATRNATILHVLAFTGMRREEAALLRVRDIDLDARMIRVRGTKTDAADRRVPILPDLGSQLLRYLVQRETRLDASPADVRAQRVDVLWDLRGGLSADGLGQMMTTLGRASGVRVGVRAHSFRRFCASEMKAAGVDDSAVLDALGWEDVTMLRRYTKARRQQNSVNEILRKMSDR